MSLVLGEHVAGLIVVAGAMLSMLLNFLMDFQARHAIEEPRKQMAKRPGAETSGNIVSSPTRRSFPWARRECANSGVRFVFFSTWQTVARHGPESLRMRALSDFVLDA